MSAAHTPGPWRLADGNASSFVYALDETGGVNRFSCLVQGGYSYCGRTHKDRTLESEIAANARLIAAAPELLEALQGAMGALEQDYDAGKDMGDADWEGIAFQRLEAARAAIAKASPSAPPTPPAGAVHAASDSAPAHHGNSQRSVEAGSERDGI